MTIPARVSAGTTITASILCTLLSLVLISTTIKTLRILGGAFGTVHTSVLVLAVSVLGILSTLVLTIGTILLWCRQSSGRVLALSGLAVLIAVNLIDLAMSLFTIDGPVLLGELALSVLALAFTVLPATAAFLRSRGVRP